MIIQIIREDKEASIQPYLQLQDIIMTKKDQEKKATFKKLISSGLVFKAISKVGGRSKIIGYAAGGDLELFKWQSKYDKHYGKKDTTYLASIGILHDWQGLGIGKDIFKKFIGISKKRVMYYSKNKHMVRLGKSLGFKEKKVYSFSGQFYSKMELTKSSKGKVYKEDTIK